MFYDFSLYLQSFGKQVIMNVCVILKSLFFTN